MDAEIRATFYELLAEAFLPPFNKGWAALKTRAAHHVFKRVSKLYPLQVFHETLISFEETLRNMDSETNLKELEQEYNRLMGGPYRLLAPPYESIYRGEERQVMAPCAIEVEKLYKENGLRVSSEFKDLPDHISAELQFMAFLCMKEEESKRPDNEKEMLQFIKKQDSFNKEHLGLWIDDFTRQLTSSSKSPFYFNLGKLVSLFIKLDSDIISLHLKDK